MISSMSFTWIDMCSVLRALKIKYTHLTLTTSLIVKWLQSVMDLWLTHWLFSIYKVQQFVLSGPWNDKSISVLLPSFIFTAMAILCTFLSQLHMDVVMNPLVVSLRWALLILVEIFWLYINISTLYVAQIARRK